MNKRTVFFWLLLLLITQPCFADTLMLKSGKKVEGKIVARTKQYVRVDFHGIPLTYWWNEIDSVNGTQVPATPHGNVPVVENTDEQRALVGQLLEQTQAIEGIQRMLVTRGKREASHGNSEAAVRLKQLTLEAAQPAAIRRICVDVFDKHYDRQRLVETLQWTKTPLGTKLRQLEQQAVDPAAAQDIGQFLAQFTSHPLPAERLSLLHRIVSATHIMEVEIAVEKTALRSATDSVKAYARTHAREDGSVQRPDGQIVTAAQMKEYVAGLEHITQNLPAELQPKMEKAALLNWAVILRSVPDSELDSYLKFLGSDSGQWYYRTLAEAATATLLSYFEKIRGIVEAEAWKPHQPDGSVSAATYSDDPTAR